MREERKKKALQQPHKVSLEKATSSSAGIAKIVGSCDNAILKMFVENGIDWIPREILSSIVQKALTLIDKE